MGEIKTVTLVFVNGCSLKVGRKGDTIWFHDENDSPLCEAEDFPSIDGIWFEEQDCTIPWDEVIDYKHTDFHLTSDMYLDNGQVVEEGKITKMIVEFTEGMSETWIPGDMEWEGTNNVYCEACDTQYEVRVNLDDYHPHWCTFCGSSHGLLLKEGN